MLPRALRWRRKGPLRDCTRESERIDRFNKARCVNFLVHEIWRCEDSRHAVF